MTGVTIVEKAAAGQRKQLRVFVKGLQHAALFAQIDDESKKLAVDDLTANVIRVTINLYTRGGESVKGSGKTAKKLCYNHLHAKYPHLLEVMLPPSRVRQFSRDLQTHC